jgi:hypothetical protein
VTTVETIDRVKNKLEASLSVEEAKRITKNGPVTENRPEMTALDTGKPGK